MPTGGTLAWRAAAYQSVRRAIMAACWHPITDGKVVVELTYFWPDRRRRDTHNRIKELTDVLQEADAFADNCQALAREWDLQIDRQRPRVEVAVGGSGRDGASGLPTVPRRTLRLPACRRARGPVHRLRGGRGSSPRAGASWTPRVSSWQSPESSRAP